MKLRGLVNLFLALLLPVAQAVSLDVKSKDSVNAATALIAKGLMDYYQGNKYGGTVGMMTAPYYWWEAGAAWNGILEYWFITGDETYNAILKESLLYQVGTNKDYLPSNQSTTEGNDDQGFWGITAMAAAERNFSNPSQDQPGWLYLAQAVFNQMVTRWDTANCNGGLRWQIYTWNAGYDYKNTVSNGCMFNLAARLARFTGNQTYVDWATKIWDWLQEVEFLNYESSVFKLYDGAHFENGCKNHTNIEWTYNYGLLLSGSAFLYDFTNQSSVWEERATELWERAKVFFDDGVMYEAACNPKGGTLRCNNDQRCFKAIFSRFLGHTAVFIPSLQDDIMSSLDSSAAAAAQSCSGGSDGHTCGLSWTASGWDGLYGLGEQMSALEVMLNTQILTVDKPLSKRTGATSNGSDNAGSTQKTLNNPLSDQTVITGTDRAGAGVLTAVILVALLSIGFWMIWK